MKCKDCKFWIKDKQEKKSGFNRGECWSLSAEETGQRTIEDYGCRMWTKKGGE